MQAMHTGAHPRAERFALSLHRVLALMGRMGLSFIFLISGFTKIMDFGTTEGFMASKNMPMAATLLVGAILVEVVGGLCVLLGYKTRWFALLLALYLVPTTLIFHNFWAYIGAEQQMQMTNFLKNCAIIGGLLTLASCGATWYSIDHAKEGYHDNR